MPSSSHRKGKEKQTGSFEGDPSYMRVADIIQKMKSLDSKTGGRVGNLVRVLTNVNTRRYWDKKLLSRGNSWRDFPYQYLSEFLPCDENFSLLDVGCALGEGCALLKQRFPEAEISGADFSSVAIEKAGSKFENIEFLVLDIQKQDPPRKYDYVTLVHILEHFNNPFSIVDKCLLFVDKALLIEVPYVESFRDPRLFSFGQHRYLFNERTFSEYNCEVLTITEYISSAGYRYILFKIMP